MPSGTTTPNNGLLVSTLPISEANVTNLTTDLGTKLTASVATVHVSSAEFLNLNSTPKAMIAAPGAGKVLVPSDVLCVYNFATTDYTIADKIEWIFADTAGTNPTSLSDDHFAGSFGALAASQIFYMSFPGDFTFWNTHVPLSYVTNKALSLWAKTSNPTGGDGTFDFMITYRTVTL